MAKTQKLEEDANANSSRCCACAPSLFPSYHCSVWPAWWSQAPDWPSGGEIDTFEGVNLQTNNQMAMHTEEGCTATGTSSVETGTPTYPNCASTANDNSGCTVTDSSAASYGAPFAAAGGGVWATELSSTGVSIWFFSRANIPADLLTSNTAAIPDPSTWGTPAAFYSSSSCSIDKFFNAQHLVLDITLCGDWAGSASVFSATCSGTCYTDFVLDSSQYSTAYFEIPSIRVYSSSSEKTGSASGGGRVLGSVLGVVTAGMAALLVI